MTEAGAPRPRRRLSPDTIAVAAGRPPRGPDVPLAEPVTLASTYHAGGPVAYGRDGNPTWDALEKAISALEGGTAVAFASGMAAVAAVLDGVPPGGVVVVPAAVYTGTRTMFARGEERKRWTVRTVDATDTGAALAACAGADLLWVESPANPTMDVADLPALAEGAHEAGATVAVDNTFATPLCQRPLELGADAVVHSVTKFLAGHSDVVLGAAAADSDGTCAAWRKYRSVHGAVPGPMEAFLALRGLRTLGVRMARAQASARDLAERLTGHPAIERVRYPGLASDPGHSRAAAQMTGFGAMLAFEVTGGADAAEMVARTVRLIVHATSLGGVETAIERRARWPGEVAPPGLLRLSVGCEDVEDLWDDLDHALRLATT